MDDWRQRLLTEHHELVERLAQLNKIIDVGGGSATVSERRTKLTAERNALSDRLEKLNAAVSTVSLPDQQMALLISQAYAMTAYFQILEQRIATL